MALLAVPVLDELCSGVVPAGAPEVARDLAVPEGLAAGGIVAAFYGLALVEAPLLVWIERYSARVVLSASVFAMGLTALAMALGSSAWALALALAAFGPAAGISGSVAEGVLVEQRGDTSRERVMARVTLAAALGDLVVPLALALSTFVGAAWRSVLGLAFAASVLVALVHARSRALDRPLPREDDDETTDTAHEEQKGEAGAVLEGWAALRAALAHRPLVMLSLASTSIGLLDEVLVAFAAIHLADVAPGADTLASRQAALGALIVGGLVGLAALERFVETQHARRVLGVACALSVVSTITLALAPDLVTAGSALFALGVGSSVLHPLVKARAYEAMPGRPMLVNAVAAALVPLDAIAPLAIGALVYAAGSSVGVLVLALAPLGVMLLSRLADRRMSLKR